MLKAASDFAGLSPRVRGSPLTASNGSSLVRSIPASAGEPSIIQREKGADKVYPRECGGARVKSDFRQKVTGLSPECGGAVLLHEIEMHRLGLSPRVRGSPISVSVSVSVSGSIPASAGEPLTAIAQSKGRGVYPRECGGAFTLAGATGDYEGLSPRVRGSLRRSADTDASRGSIPASAGEPLTDSAALPSVWVYPRECGGADKEVPSDI